VEALDPRPSRTARQRDLIAVAARLFAARGYHAVGINDISGELGLTGPAFYRHYPSKEALLVAVLEDAVHAHLEELGAIVALGGDPLAALTAIVEHHVAFVFDHGQDITTWRTEFRILPERDRHYLRYVQRLYVEHWVRAVQQVRPELDADEARALCHGAIALLQNPLEFHSDLGRERLSRTLASMAMAVLVQAPVPAGAS
jgi:AcrR family transcriptional regulator